MKLFKLKITKTTFSVISATIFISVSLMMSSCKKPGDTFEKFDASNLRVVNGLPGRTNVKFYLDTFNLTLTGTLNYGVVSSPMYYAVKSGLRTAKLYSTTTKDTFAEKSIQLDPKNAYTFFVAGDTTTPKYFLTKDDLTETTPDKVKIRLANLAQTGSNVDVKIQYYDQTDPTLPVQPEVTVLMNVAPQSISDYALATVRVSKGNSLPRLHKIRVYEAGTTNAIDSTSGVDLRGTSINTFIHTGIQGGSPALVIKSVRDWLDW